MILYWILNPFFNVLRYSSKSFSLQNVSLVFTFLFLFFFSIITSNIILK